MAKEKNLDKNLSDMQAQSSRLIYGIGPELGEESTKVQEIITRTVRETSSKLGVKAGSHVVEYFNEVNISKIFNQILKNQKASSDKKVTADDFKKFMEEQNISGINDILANNADKQLAYNNYRAIYKHIPECAQALDTYRDNIMSPDDFTKMVFNIKYDGDPSDSVKKDVDEHLKEIILKYKIADKADRIIGESLLLGEQYVAVLSIDQDLTKIMNDPVYAKNKGQDSILTESAMRTLDESYYSRNLQESDIVLNESETAILTEIYGEALSESTSLEAMVADIVNKNLVIGSKYEMLQERYEAEEQNLIEAAFEDRLKDKKKKSDKKEDNRPLYLNGSSIKILDTERVIDLRIDDVCYGYYYATETGSNINNVGTMNPNTGRELKQSVQIGSNNTLMGTNTVDYVTNNTVSKELNVDEAKLNLITNIFVNAISKKINKSYIRKNKEFKGFIYSLIKQDYIIKRGVKLTYFLPEEVIKFEVPALFRKIIFFAKLYLAMLSNTLLIKLGRAHDKRLFYVNVGMDADYEQAINKVIQDIKTKEYKMDNLNDINTILNLTPGRFDDYFIPSVNGERPLEIETMPGMDTEMTNEFMEFLKASMLSGIGIPRDLIDSLNNVDFARTLSAQNANFVRSVIKYQMKYTEPFTQMIRRLYKNEYMYNDNTMANSQELEAICRNIMVEFPSPASLNFSNMSDSMQAADSNAEFIASQLLPPRQDGSTEDARAKLKAQILRDMLPSVDWEKYDDYKDKVMLDMKYEEAGTPPPPPEEEQGMY